MICSASLAMMMTSANLLTSQTSPSAFFATLPMPHSETVLIPVLDDGHGQNLPGPPAGLAEAKPAASGGV